MTDLRSALDRYLIMRQGFGYKYQKQARRLADFVSFMEARKATTITTKLALEWATLPPGRHASWASRLTDVRGFARHVANFDPETEAPHPLASNDSHGSPLLRQTARRPSRIALQHTLLCR